MDIQKIQQDMTERAKGVIESGQEFMPVCFLVSSSGQLNIMGLMFNDDAEKRRAYQAVAEMAKKTQTIAIISIQDTWAIKRDKDWQPGDELPRNAPDRTEALTVSLVMPDASIASFMHYPYERVQGGIIWGEVIDAGDASGETQQFFIPAWGEMGRAQ